MGFGYFAWDNRCTRKTFFGIASSLLAFVPNISSMPRVTNRIQESNRIEGKIVRETVPFQVPFDRLYPRVKIKTDDEALNERKNTIDDTHTSRRHYYPRNNLIEGGSFLSRWSVSVSHDDLRSLTLCGADTFYRDLSGSRQTRARVSEFQSWEPRTWTRPPYGYNETRWIINKKEEEEIKERKKTLNEKGARKSPLEKRVRFRGRIIRFKGKREGSKNKATFPPCNFRRYRGCNGSEKTAFDIFVTKLDLLDAVERKESGSVRHGSCRVSPIPPPLFITGKHQSPRRAKSLINSCRFIKRALQIIILLFFSHLSQEKSFHLATHFPFPWRPFFRLSRKPLITSIARDSSYREKVTRFLFESRDREREANQMHRLKSFDRGTVSERPVQLEVSKR